jgi:hypothetical protein
MRALVATEHGAYAVDVEAEEVLGLEEADVPQRTADSSGSTAVVILDRRPPLRLSHDGGATWTDAGGGLPPGHGVAVHPERPELVLYAGRNRLYLSEDGGVFWHALAFELPEIRAVAWSEG